MKNISSIYDILLVLMLMVVGVLNTTALLSPLRTEFRFEDKSLIPVEEGVSYTYDTLTEEYTAKELWDTSFDRDYLYAMIYVQNYDCPETKDGVMKLKAGSYTYSIDDNWKGIMNTSFIRVYNEFSPAANAGKHYKLIWNKTLCAWVVTEV